MPNPETGLMENRTISVLRQVVLKKTAPNTLSVASSILAQSNPLAFFQGDIWAWVMRSTDGFCLISMKTNLTAAAQDIQKYLQIPADFKPYLFGMDEYSGVAFPKLLGSFKQDPSKFPLE